MLARQDYMQKEWLLAQVQPCKAGEKKKKKRLVALETAPPLCLSS